MRITHNIIEIIIRDGVNKAISLLNEENKSEFVILQNAERELRKIINNLYRENKLKNKSIEQAWLLVRNSMSIMQSEITKNNNKVTDNLKINKELNKSNKYQVYDVKEISSHDLELSNSFEYFKKVFISKRNFFENVFDRLLKNNIIVKTSHLNNVGGLLFRNMVKLINESFLKCDLPNLLSKNKTKAIIKNLSLSKYCIYYLEENNQDEYYNIIYSLDYTKKNYLPQIHMTNKHPFYNSLVTKSEYDLLKS